jgi:hypothetical protein
MTLSIQLPDDAERPLREARKRLRIPVGHLAAAAVQDFVTRPSAAFEQAANRAATRAMSSADA